MHNTVFSELEYKKINTFSFNYRNRVIRIRILQIYIYASRDKDFVNSQCEYVREIGNDPSFSNHSLLYSCHIKAQCITHVFNNVHIHKLLKKSCFLPALCYIEC